MRFTDTFLDEIRDRLPISQVVGEHVVWDRRKSQPGKGDMWACCPFHGEKSPSFHADDRRGRYHCFGCGASGDHFRFLSEKTGMSFPEAVELLAGRAGVPMPARDERAERREQARRTLHEVMDLAARYFTEALAHNVGARARGYLHTRGVSGASQERFRLGFAPESRNGLKEFLAANGVSAQQMSDAGLVARREGDPLPFDRFRNRLMFPITDARGKVIAFGGRALSPDAAAKYLNSPETELFSKRRTLYNLQAARQAGYDGKSIIVVEGYLDVVAAVAAGFEGAVAPLGTALTEEHLSLLWKMTDVPVLCFDGDAAGQRAAAKSVDLALPLLVPGKSIALCTLPEGLDPDDLIREQGREAFAGLLAGAQPLADAVWSVETAGGLPEAPEARAALEARLRQRANSIGDGTVRRHYAQAFEDKVRAVFSAARHQGEWRGGAGRAWDGGQGRRGEGGRGDGARAGAGRASPRAVVSDTLRNSRLLKGTGGGAPQIIPREAVIVATLVNHPELVGPRLELLAGLEFAARPAQVILRAVLDVLTHHPDMGPDGLRQALEGRGLGEPVARMAQLVRAQGIWQAEPDSDGSDAETGLKHALALHYKSVQLNRERKAAEQALGESPSEMSFERLRDILNQIASIDGTEALIEGFGSLSGRATRSL